MAKKSKQGSSSKTGFAGDVRAMTIAMLEDGDVTRFEMTVDKALGLARLRVVGADGRVTTRELLGAGLDLPTLPASGDTAADRTARNAAILACRAKGLTQAETARLLNVSQPLVSKVLRAAKN